MKKIGIIGGLSPESTIIYYQWLNAGVNKKLGGHHNAKILLSSVDFAEFVAFKEKGDWDSQADILCREALALEKAGADFIILATNTMHKMADQIEQAINIPFLHIADATANKIAQSNIDTIGLLATKYTMEGEFYTGRLNKRSIQTIIPNPDEIKIVNDIIYNELCHGIIKPESQIAYRKIMNNLIDRGAKGIILGCTEITMLINQDHSDLPLFDTTAIHVEEALIKCFE